jgi:hypothetical protein
MLWFGGSLQYRCHVYGVTPVPVKEIACGELGALSVATRFAVSVPAATGLNAMDKVQLAPAASDVMQVLPLRTKELALVPVKR